MPLSEDDRRLLGEWARHPGAAIARAYVLELRDVEFAALGKSLYENAASFDPVKVAEAAGRHKGRLEVLNQATFAAKAIERQDARKDSDESA
jgi:hypothetical protein